MSNQQAQIEALEHFVLALFKELDQKHGLPLSRIVDSAKSSVLGSDGAGGPEQKSAAVQYLDSLGFRLGTTRRS
ncbi:MULTISPECIES: hypothetical protein [Pseudomonas]|uniref:hypothetical protein n=1 Tax=Pseudomonas TaxID=286 RepID=UPI0015970111|nr:MULTISPECIES: hypothetical protein [Pseudomonas]